MRHWTLIIFLLLAVRIAGWQDEPTEAAPFDSPIPMAGTHKIYIPLISYASSKKCAAIGEVDQIEQVKQLNSNCTYVYWGYTYTGTVEVINMLKQGDPLALTNNSQYFLGWNEPDLSGLTPQAAAALWPLAVASNPSKQAVSPAPSDLHPEWLEQFLMLINHKPDVLAIHCYKIVVECERIIGQVIGYADQYGIGAVWVTEFGYQGVDWQAQAQSLIDWMNAQPKIKRFYWFAAAADGYWSGQNLIDSTGQLTDKGTFYKAIK